MSTPTLALSTGSLYSYGLARVFELAARCGFEAIEVLIDERWDTRQAPYLCRLIDAYGLPIVALHNPFMPHVPGWPPDPVGRLRRTVDLAREVGAGVVVAHLPLAIRGARLDLFGFKSTRRMMVIPLPNEADYRRFLLHDLAGFEAAAGVTVAVENMPAKMVFGRRLDIHRLNRLDTWAALPHLTLDTTHLGTWGIDPLAVYPRIRERLRHVHLSNFDGREHRLPPDGRLALDRLLGRLAADGYQGAISVEVGPEVVEAEDEGKVQAHLKRAAAYCRESLGCA